LNQAKSWRASIDDLGDEARCHRLIVGLVLDGTEGGVADFLDLDPEMPVF